VKIKFMPATRTGKWSGWLIIGFFVFILLFNIIVTSVRRSGDTFSVLDPFNIPLALALICAVASLVTGLIAIIRHKERAVSVFLAAAIGFYFLFLIAGEFLFPH